MGSEQRPRLENWSVVGSLGPYQAPEQMTQHLAGEVFGHALHVDGKVVVTSRLLSLDLEAGAAVTTSGTLYELGEPSVEWLAWLHAEGKSLSAYGFKMQVAI